MIRTDYKGYAIRKDKEEITRPNCIFNKSTVYDIRTNNNLATLDKI